MLYYDNKTWIKIKDKKGWQCAKKVYLILLNLYLKSKKSIFKKTDIKKTHILKHNLKLLADSIILMKCYLSFCDFLYTLR